MGKIRFKVVGREGENFKIDRTPLLYNVVLLFKGTLVAYLRSSNDMQDCLKTKRTQSKDFYWIY